MPSRWAKLKRQRWANYATLGNCTILRGEVEISEKEINELNNQKEVAEKEDVDKICLTQEEKEQEKKERTEE